MTEGSRTQPTWSAADFDYPLPEALIAQTPTAERGASRMLVVDRTAGGATHASPQQASPLRDGWFTEITDLIPSDDLVVVNSTRVRHARLHGTRPTGGPAEVLLIHPAPDDTWIAMGSPGSAMKPGKRIVEGPFGEAPGYLGPQRYTTCVEYHVRAINYRKGGMYQSVITPEGDKPWMDLPREGAYLRRCREAIPGVTAVCKMGRHAHYNVFISMKKMSEGDPGRAAAAALTFDHTKNVFVFDDDIDVFNATDILWALATRVQPHRQVSILQPLFRGNFLDPSLVDEIKTSGMIVDATRPLDRPFSPVSKCPDDAMERIKLEDYIPGEILQHIPTDRTTYWC